MSMREWKYRLGRRVTRISLFVLLLGSLPTVPCLGTTERAAPTAQERKGSQSNSGVKNWELEAAAAFSTILENGNFDPKVYRKTLQYIVDLHTDPALVALDEQLSIWNERVRVDELKRRSEMAASQQASLDRRRQATSASTRRWVERAEQDGIWSAAEQEEYDRRYALEMEAWQLTPAEEAQIAGEQAVRDAVADEIKRGAYRLGGLSDEEVSERMHRASEFDAATRTWRNLLFTGRMANAVAADIAMQRERGILANNMMMSAEIYMARTDITEQQRAIAQDVYDAAHLTRGAAADAISKDIALVLGGAASDVALLGLGRPVSIVGRHVDRGLRGLWGRLFGTAEAAAPAASAAGAEAGAQAAARAWGPTGKATVSEAFGNPNLADDAWVHFGPSEAAASMEATGVNGFANRSSWVRWGDVKNLTQAEVRWGIGPMSASAESNLGAMAVAPEGAAVRAVNGHYTFAVEGIAEGSVTGVRVFRAAGQAGGAAPSAAAASSSAGGQAAIDEALNELRALTPDEQVARLGSRSFAERGRILSQMSAAEREAYVAAARRIQINQGVQAGLNESQILGQDVLPNTAAQAAPAGQLSAGLTAAERAALFEPGANLTRAQLLQKADILIAEREAQLAAAGQAPPGPILPPPGFNPTGSTVITGASVTAGALAFGSKADAADADATPVAGFGRSELVETARDQAAERFGPEARDWKAYPGPNGSVQIRSASGERVVIAAPGTNSRGEPVILAETYWKDGRLWKHRRLAAGVWLESSGTFDVPPPAAGAAFDPVAPGPGSDIVDAPELIDVAAHPTLFNPLPPTEGRDSGVQLMGATLVVPSVPDGVLRVSTLLRGERRPVPSAASLLDVLQSWVVPRAPARGIRARGAHTLSTTAAFSPVRAEVAHSGATQSPSSPSSARASVFFTSLGVSSGEAFEMQVFHDGRAPLNLSGEGFVLEPVKKKDQEKLRRELARLGPESSTTVKIDAYCLEYSLKPPSTGAMYRIADRELQERFAPVRRILESSRRLQQAGALEPDSDPTEYFHSIRQWAIWSHEGGFDAPTFERAFKKRAKENFSAAGVDWNERIERTIDAITPQRWSDVVKVLRAAGVLSASR